jgi:uncharacterized membrane protein YeaQ/YmgE (transglycosylase-associated protein family)
MLAPLPALDPSCAGQDGQTAQMHIFGFIAWTILTGVIVGGLGRLAIPGPNPMPIGATMLIGLGGALIGGVIGALLRVPWPITFILEVAAAAAIVYVIQRRPIAR